MTEIKASDVKKLREMTKRPLLECRQALQQAGGDLSKAAELLGQTLKSLPGGDDWQSSEGQVFVKVAGDGCRGAMLEIVCQSAPVATGEELTRFGSDLVETLFRNDISNVDALLAGAGPDGVPFERRLRELLTTIREKILVRRLVKVEGPVAGYVHHDRKTGVLFAVTGDKANDPVVRDVAMHIAALRPSVTRPAELDPALVGKWQDQFTREAKLTGKPDHLVKRIVEGKMNAFYVEQGVLLYQQFARDDSKTVQQALAECGLTANSFTRFTIGAAG